MTFLMIYGAFAFLKASVPFHYDGMVKIFKHSPLVICKRKVPKYRNFRMKDSYNLLVHALRNMTCSSLNDIIYCTMLKNKQVSMMLQTCPSFMLRHISVYFFSRSSVPSIIESHCQAEAAIRSINAHTPLQFIL